MIGTELYSMFRKLNPNLVKDVYSFAVIDDRSIRVKMKDGKIYIFTYHNAKDWNLKEEK